MFVTRTAGIRLRLRTGWTCFSDTTPSADRPSAAGGQGPNRELAANTSKLRYRAQLAAKALRELATSCRWVGTGLQICRCAQQPGGRFQILARLYAADMERLHVTSTELCNGNSFVGECFSREKLSAYKKRSEKIHTCVFIMFPVPKQSVSRGYDAPYGR